MDLLKVTARLRTNIICDRWLPLDSILHAQHCRECLPELAVTVPGEQPAELDMPFLKKRHIGTPFWYYACSWAQWQPQEGKDHWNKRLDSSFAYLVDFGKKRGKIIIEQGAYKAYHMPIFYFIADRIEWYCVGIGDEIRRLLGACTHLGKKTTQGWGRVATWLIESWPEDWSVRRDGKLTRGVPARDAGEIPQDMHLYGIRPSYYNKNNQILLVMPKSERDRYCF